MSFHVGEDIGDYRVVSMLGAGSVGQVFLVEHRITKRKEAAKVLLADVASDSQFLRFMREIEVQGRLDHANIAKVHNALHFKNSLILAMEFVEGCSLEKLLQKGRLPINSGIEYICQTLSGLHYAHTRGVVHRDVTPGNLMITPDGRVKLTDFGLAKSLGDYQLTNDGDVVGSLYYMPPEQVRQQCDPDPRSDIYSTGAVLYEILTGKKIFEYSDRLSLMVAQVQKQPVQPSDIEPEIGPELNAIVLKALAKNPAQRYQSAEEFRLALKRAGKSSGFAPAIASRMRVVTLALAVCAMAETGGVEKLLLRTSVSPAVQPAHVPASVSAPISESKVTAHYTKRPRALLRPPIEEQPETVSETLVEPQQQPTEEPATADSAASAAPQQEPSRPNKKRFWSKLNPFKWRKSDRSR
jgi:serine/threonine-protein kinase